MSFTEYADYDGLGLAKLIAKKDVSPKEVVEAAIDRIEKHNPTLNAVVWKGFEDALEQADEPLGDGPFAGVPFLVKDLDASVGGWPRSSGSKYMMGEVPAEDSELVARYREAGVILMGKTNTPEFGITGTTESAALGPCRNPWNPDHSSGGSSGGSAAAVASGMVPLAHASDGLGSIRIPAACCGLVGLKTTRDRTPLAPNYREASHGFVVQHVVSRTVRDSAAMLDATDYADPALPWARPRKLRPFMQELRVAPGPLKIAVSSKTPNGKPIHPDVQKVFDRTCKLLEAQGHWVEPYDLEIDWRSFFRHQAIKSGANFRAEMLRRIEEKGREPEEHELEPLTWAGFKGVQGLPIEMVAEATRALADMSAEILRKLGRYDAYLTPVMTEPPAEIGHVDPVNLDPKEVNKRQGRLYPYTPQFNITGQPSLSLPLGTSANGLPIGMQFTARYDDEATLIRLAAQLEEASPWAGRRPPHYG
ncbi:MAG: amidase family protein [Alphaproteobacteria bacterium]